MICSICHTITRHGTKSAEQNFFLCSRCVPSSVLKVKNPNETISYICVYQEWLSKDSCHEILKLDKKHESNGRYYADSLVCPKGHTRIVMDY